MAENMDDGDEGTTVEVFVYDLTKGTAAMMSQMLIGRHLDGIWHTAVVAYGREYFFGPMGIQSVRPGGTELQEPQRIEKVGQTYLPYSVFYEYINGLGTTKFAPGTYNLFKHNCNNFSDEVSNFLVGTGIPKYILDLPEEILQTPVGQALFPLIENLSRSATAGLTVGNRFVEARINREDSPEFQSLNTEIEQASRINSIALEEKRNVINEKLAKKERKKKKKDKKKKDKSRDQSGSETNSTGVSDMADSENAAAAVAEVTVEETVQDQADAAAATDSSLTISERVRQMEADERREVEELKRQRDPPIVFRDLVDPAQELEKLRDLLAGKLNEAEIQNVDELHQYILDNEGSWALGDNFLSFVGRIFNDKSLDSSVRVCLLNLLCVAALKDDVILLLHQDRREHTIMNFAYDIDRHPVEEQLPLAQFVANLFENLSSSEWLMYISEWQYQNQNISNIRVTTKLAVHSLLSDSEDLQMRGTAVIHNLACKEVKTVVFDDVAVELTMALLQYFNGTPQEEQLFACMKSLAKFTQVSGQDVPQLIQMIGPEPAKFRGCSQRIDDLIEQINVKLRLH
ncbi:uncharacterized protein LOC106648391 isoform X1 [Trichogramma pretiosum]|uniref:uncharacterized protein LOC106648391 isoform X1 n=2 Tax=Trichogramma pretiosum TaxID=7493 RepID=UPI000C71A835|nr:uncharacterized protein LOC106648391 isoform X1 [Trichogramma pretiosum]